MSEPDDANAFKTMRTLGHACDLTSHQVGKVLRDAGFRDTNGKPTLLAYARGIVRPYKLQISGKQAYLWLESAVLPLAKQRAASHNAAS